MHDPELRPPEVRARPRPAVPVIQFLGGTGTVTGSRFLVETRRARILVDCGLYQGPKKLRLKNWAALPFATESIDAVVLTHAHVDHSGFLPALYRQGFRGGVWCTRGSAELCRIVLLDSARIHQEDAQYANRIGFSKHAPALPLYTEADASGVIERFRTVPYGQPVEVAPGVRATLGQAGHILGSATVELEIEGDPVARIAFSGDLGRGNHPLLVDPEPMGAPDVCLIEATYGDREHEHRDWSEQLAKAVVRTAGRGGTSVIPAFAVDRTELVLLSLKRLTEAGRIPSLPIYVDSPMALDALAVYRRAIAEGWSEIRPELHGSDNPFDAGRLHEARDVQSSRQVAELADPAIVIAASGMATGGRVLHHLRRRLPDPKNSILLVGYQAVGTRGRRLLEGQKQLKLLGSYVPVRAQIDDLTGFSVHADRAETLQWLRRATRPPGCTYVVHGEAEASAALRRQIAEELAWHAIVPKEMERVRVDVGPGEEGAAALGAPDGASARAGGSHRRSPGEPRSPGEERGRSPRPQGSAVGPLVTASSKRSSRRS